LEAHQSIREGGMHTTGFDKTNMDNTVGKMIMDAIKEVPCPKCHQHAKNISVENGKLRFEACCDELRQAIMDKIGNDGL
jgi:hypothetical protein